MKPLGRTEGVDVARIILLVSIGLRQKTARDLTGDYRKSADLKALEKYGMVSVKRKKGRMPRYRLSPKGCLLVAMFKSMDLWGWIGDRLTCTRFHPPAVPPIEVADKVPYVEMLENGKPAVEVKKDPLHLVRDTGPEMETEPKG